MAKKIDTTVPSSVEDMTVDNLQKLLNEQKDAYKKLEEQQVSLVATLQHLKEQDAELEQLKTDYNILVGSNDDQTKELEQLRFDYMKLGGELNVLFGEKTELENLCQTLKMENRILASERDNYYAKVQAVNENNNSTLLDTINKLTNENNELRTLIPENVVYAPSDKYAYKVGDWVNYYSKYQNLQFQIKQLLGVGILGPIYGIYQVDYDLTLRIPENELKPVTNKFRS